MPSWLLPTLAPPAGTTSSSRGSSSYQARANNRAVSAATAPKSTLIDPVAPSTPAPAAATAQSQVATAGSTTSSTSLPTTTTTASTTTTSTTTTSTTTPATAPTRTVEGTAVTLGAGSFTGGTDVAPGLYDVTTGPDRAAASSSMARIRTTRSSTLQEAGEFPSSESRYQTATRFRFLACLRSSSLRFRHRS